MFRFKLKNNAQTLLEVMIAIGITVMALVAILSLVLSTMVASGQVVERTVAVFLAREGIEMTKNIRDSNWLDPTQTWSYGLNDGDYTVGYNIDANNSYCSVDNNCLMSAGASNISSCTKCQLDLTSDDRYVHAGYGYDGFSPMPTNFRRMIKISIGDNDDERRIQAIVYWTERGRGHQVSIEEILTNWR